ncbi:hypothetical protein CL622_06710 [archaeon]|nr:hypothetical protein [archaeon]
MTAGLVLILLALFLTYQIRDTKTEITVDQIRVTTLTDFGSNIEDAFIVDIMKLSLKQALVAMQDELKQDNTNSAFNDPPTAISNLMIYGSIDGSGGVTNSFMDDFTIAEQIASFESLSGKSGLDSTEITLTGVASGGPLKNLDDSDLKITQDDAWSVIVQQPDGQPFSVRLELSTQDPKIDLDRTFSITPRVSLIDFAQDPILLRNGGELKIIQASSFPNSPTDYTSVANDQEFVERNGGRSYLDRFKPSPGSSSLGIERPLLPGHVGGNSQKYRLLDWQYYGGVSADDDDCVVSISSEPLCNPSGSETNFRFDSGLAGQYGLSTCSCGIDVGCNGGYSCTSQSCTSYCSYGVDSSYTIPQPDFCRESPLSRTCCDCSPAPPPPSCPAFSCPSLVDGVNGGLGVNVWHNDYIDGLGCSTACTCPIGTNTIKFTYIIDTELNKDVFSIVGGQSISGKDNGELTATLNPNIYDPKIITFETDSDDNYATGAGNGLKINKIECQT